MLLIMPEITVTEIMKQISERKNLIILVGNNEKNLIVFEKLKKTIASAVFVNVGYELSQKLIHDRIKISQNPNGFFDKLLKDKDGKIIILNNCEILFDSNLSFDPLSIIKKIATEHRIICMLNANYNQNQITFSKPGHDQYRSYNIDNNEGYVVSSEDVVL